MKNRIHTLASLKAPQPYFDGRGLPPQTTVKDPKFWDMYDNDTLIFDCVWQAHKNRLRVFMPKLLEFQKRLLDCSFMLDGTPAPKPKLIQFRQYDILDFKARHPVSKLTLITGDQSYSLPIHHAEPDRYAGRNVLYTKVQNDDLNWIYDWGLAHQRNHGANAILVTDNASTAYSSEELQTILSAIPGIAVADILQSPQPHGPGPSLCSGTGWAKFQQVLCMNICRDRFLTDARAVLTIDVDELVTSCDGTSIFDATVQTPTKYTRFGGQWRYAQPKDSGVRHADHVLSDKYAQPCNSKYCIVPNSFLGRTSWSVHSLDSVNRRVLKPRKNFQMLHCYGINTSWKKNRQNVPARAGDVDPKTQAFMDATFQNTSQKQTIKP